MEHEHKVGESRMVKVENETDIPLSVGVINLNAGHTTEIVRYYPDIQNSKHFTKYIVGPNEKLHSSLDITEYTHTPEAKKQENIDIIIELIDGELSNNNSSVTIYSDLLEGSSNQTQKEYWNKMISSALKITYDSNTARKLLESIKENDLPHNAKKENFKNLSEVFDQFPEITENDNEDTINKKAESWLQAVVVKRKR